MSKCHKGSNNQILVLLVHQKLDVEVKQSKETTTYIQSHTHTKPSHMVKNRLPSLILHEPPLKMN